MRRCPGTVQPLRRHSAPPSAPTVAPTEVRILRPVPGPRRPACPTEADPGQTTPRVFVSYTHDDSAHMDAVRALSEFLAADCGFDVRMDRWDLDRRRDWYRWAVAQITRADFVLVVASPQCKAVGDGNVPNTGNLGMQSELALLRELLHGDRDTWTTKLLPVVLPGRSADEIPLFLQPRTADHYVVAELTAAGAEDLVRAISGQPQYVRPRVNPRVLRLPPRDAPG